MENYAVTIKYNYKHDIMYREDFEATIKSMCAHFGGGVDLGQVSYELDSNLVLHAHFLMVAPKHIIYKSFTLKGWHIYLRKITKDLDRWIAYTHKVKRPYELLLQDRIRGIAQRDNLFMDYQNI